MKSVYQNLVAKRIGKPQRGLRNASIVELAATLFHNVKPVFTLAFIVEYRKSHADVFADYPVEQALTEARCVLKGCDSTYPSKLSEFEREAYAALPDETHRMAFRVCRCLSRCSSNEGFPPPKFFLSCHGLGVRLGLVDTEAQRILITLEDRRKLIETVVKGTRRQKGVPGVATTYRWLPEQPEEP